MGKGIKVTINQPAWGSQVMSGQQMRSYLAGLGSQVASKIPGSTVKVSASRTVRGGGSRARAVITTPITLSEEAETGKALAALMSVVPTGHAPKGSAAAKARAVKRAGRRS